MQKGVLVIISGFSGAGKGTVVKELLKRDNYCVSVSATTRAPRKGDEEGVTYFFKTRDEFEDMIKNDKLIEYAEYVGNYYGTPGDYVEEKLSSGKNVILEIEMQGALKIKKKMPDTVLVFVTPPDFRELEKRLTDRGTEDRETVKNRLLRAKEEVDYIDDYDYIVVNDDLDTCVNQIDALVSSVRCRVSNNKEFVSELKKDFKNSKVR